MEGDFIALGASPEPPDVRTALNKPVKRKFDQALAEVVDLPESKSTPWMNNVHWTSQQSAVGQLQREIDAFTDYILPSAQEHALRASVVADIRRAIILRYRDADVQPFGSFQTKLYLPSADIDLVVLSPMMATMSTKNLLFSLAALLQKLKLVSKTLVIWKAKVPIVKCTSTRGRFMIDISINQANGLSVGRLVMDKLDAIGSRAASALIMLVKAFLAERGLNQVFSGGLSSYSVICLVISFLQLHPKLQQKRMRAEKNTAALLLEFFEFYGKHFNYDIAGVTINNRGGYYDKVRRGWSRERQPFLLSIEDPNDSSNDIAGGTHNILAVRQSFAGAFDVLAQAVAKRHEALNALHENRNAFAENVAYKDSLLGAIVTLSEDLIELRHVNGLMEVGGHASQAQPNGASHSSAQTNGNNSNPVSHSKIQPSATQKSTPKAAPKASPDLDTKPPITPITPKSAKAQKKSKSVANQTNASHSVKAEVPDDDVIAPGFGKARAGRSRLRSGEHAAPSVKREAETESKPMTSATLILGGNVDSVPDVSLVKQEEESRYSAAPKKATKRTNMASRTAFWQAKREQAGTIDEPIDLDD